MKAILVFLVVPWIGLTALASGAASGDYSVEELVQTSMLQNFDNRIEFEKVVEARKSSQMAYLNLTPRLTLNTVANIGSGGAALIQIAGDLMPFLFPSNWYFAKNQKELFKAEEVTHHIMKLDVGVQVESLANVILRDDRIIRHYQDLLNQVMPLRNEIQIREKLGQYPDGSTDNVDTVISALQRDSLTVRDNQKDQYVQLAMMAGLPDLYVINHLHWANETHDINHPWKVTRDEIQERALRLSLELQQGEFLIQAARANMKKSIWSWLDPSGGYGTGIGLAWGKSISLAKEQVIEMQVQKEKLYTVTQRDVEHAYNLFQDGLEHHRMDITNLQIQEKRKNLMIEKLQLGQKIDFFGLVQVLSDNMTARVQFENNVAQYRNQRAQLIRLALWGLQ